VGERTDCIADDEILYRRVPLAWYDKTTGLLKDEAFAPHKTNDLTGLSLARERFKSLEQAAQGQPGKQYYVAVLRAADLRANEIRIEQTPPEDPSHAELPDLNADNRKESRTLQLQRILVELVVSVLGPFDS